MNLRRESLIFDFLRELYVPRGSHELVEFILQGMPGIIAGHNNCLSRYDPARRAPPGPPKRMRSQTHEMGRM